MGNPAVGGDHEIHHAVGRHDGGLESQRAYLVGQGRERQGLVAVCRFGVCNEVGMRFHGYEVGTENLGSSMLFLPRN